mgnify:CR=1 FL=1
MNIDELYQTIILDHYREKHHSGLREPYGAQVTHVNPSCGDEVMLRVALDGDRVTDVSYEGVGCSISQASTSVMSDLVIGRTVDEAIAELDKYLDDAYLAHIPSVRVVHGKGTGALRKGIHNYLRRVKYVSSFHLAEFGEGDAGVTIVNFKK